MCLHVKIGGSSEEGEAKPTTTRLIMHPLKKMLPLSEAYAEMEVKPLEDGATTSITLINHRHASQKPGWEMVTRRMWDSWNYTACVSERVCSCWGVSVSVNKKHTQHPECSANEWVLTKSYRFHLLSFSRCFTPMRQRTCSRGVN